MTQKISDNDRGALFLMRNRRRKKKTIRIAAVTAFDGLFWLTRFFRVFLPFFQYYNSDQAKKDAQYTACYNVRKVVDTEVKP